METSSAEGTSLPPEGFLSALFSWVSQLELSVFLAPAFARWEYSPSVLCFLLAASASRPVSLEEEESFEELLLESLLESSLIGVYECRMH